VSDAAAIDQAAFDALFASVGEEAAFVSELIETYLGEAPELLAALDQAIAAGDAGVARRLAHTLKSTSASLGALHLSELSGAVEKRTATSDAGDTLALHAEFARVEAALRRYAAGAAP